MNLDQDIKQVMNTVGLTPERVRWLTEAYRPRFDPPLTSQDPGEFFYSWLEKWTSITYADAGMMMRSHGAESVSNKWNKANPDKPISRESIIDNGHKWTFFYLGEKG